jgi:hypothetical protein
MAGGPGGRCRNAQVFRGRKVRTPQGSVPDNVRDAGVKARGRPVPQRIYRLGYPFFMKGDPGPVRLNFVGGRARCRGKGEKVR